MAEVKEAQKSLRHEVRQEVNKSLAEFFDERIALTSGLSMQYGRLWRVLARFSQAGGKRLRPYMVVLAYRCFGGTNTKSALPAAMAWELLHLCMLIHDDIIDNDLVRYGVHNIAGSYREIYQGLGSDSARQNHLADASALLAGDLALSAAHEVIVECDLPAQMKLEIQRFLSRATFTVAGGELLDTEAALYPMKDADALLIARLKTASYTFVGPLITGAALAGASAADCEGIEKLGEALGCAYQLQDDLLGVFGNPLLTGKTAQGDISEGKRTYLMQQAFQSASPDDIAVLERLVGKPDLTEEEAGTVRDIIERSGARKRTEELAYSYVLEARRIADTLSIQEKCIDELRSFIGSTAERRW